MGCDRNEQSRNRLIVGTSGDYPPFEYLNKNHKLCGFDIDLGKAIAEHLGKEVEFVDMPYSSLFPALQTRKIDLIISSVAITEARKKIFDFSDPYYFDTKILVTKKGKIGTEDWAKKIVGVQMGSTMEQWAKESGKFLKVVSMDLNPKLIESLKSGHVDGVVMDKIQALSFCKKDSTLICETIVTDPPCGNAVVLKKNSPLTELVNQVIRSESIKKIEQKWLN